MRVRWLLAALCVVAAGTARAESYSYVDLVKRLTDLEGLAVLPVPGEKCQQWSSYDRASKFDSASGKYVAWDANGDGGGIIRTEGDQVVMAEMQGPGVIWRTWSAAPGDGHVRIYLDGSSVPTVNLPFSGYFDLKNEPFTYPALVHDASSGKNCYVPIPFQKSCKITADRNWGAYYHFTYTTYPKDTVLPTFTRKLTDEDRAALAAANDLLSGKLGADPVGTRPGAKTVTRQVTVKPGKAVTVAKLGGQGAITTLLARIKLANREEQVAALRELAIRIRFDGEREPSVWAPLGDFFGTAPGVNPYRSLPLGMSADEFYSHWYMPFGKGAVVEVVNDGKAERKLGFTVIHAPLDRPIEQLGRFHAKWHRDAFLPTDPGRNIEWTMLKAVGRGRFCGVALHVWNPKGGWWGEGDEMFYVDGERFPSTFGTGSEDYFGYAWCNPTPFQNCYHNQPFNSGNNKGHASVNRWHITDNVPFGGSFVGTIEKYYPNDRPTLYAATAYWYQAPGGEDPYAPAPMDTRLGYFELTAPPTYVVKDALEGESLQVAELKGGKTETQDVSGFSGKWSRDNHLWWTDAKPGDTLTLTVPVKTAGKYAVKAQLTKARDYGIVQLWWDGNKLGEPLDCYNAEVVPTGELDLGALDLTAGDHQLRLEIVGANDKAVKAYMAGLDYVRLVPAQ